ncbi:MAG: PilZ domain-containing protein [Bryobacteraceae bacterium]
MTAGSVERRREKRVPASGEVILQVEPPVSQEVRGELIDVSPSGFRVRHANASLQSGMVVEFRHALGAGKARVAWNRILSGCVESGFFLS